MKLPVILNICGKQYYDGQQPDVIELTTEGTMEAFAGGWELSYEESDLTGLAGVTTTFRVEGDRIILRRTGKLNSQMIFQQGVIHESLYQMEFGALMITVCAKRILVLLDKNGGMVTGEYEIDGQIYRFKNSGAWIG